MGIKGIYRELGPGKRVALSKLAADSLESSNRPFRLAIDIAIWQFQTQAARGGTNPALRTLFYRLTRLMGTPIQPIFVFDGPYKPAFKRNKRSGRGDGVAIAQAKRLIRLFGFPVHDAPGEAEAECAFLQTQGLVDAVLSEDVDTIMFGCTKTLRNWSSESKSQKTPTHVSLYDSRDPSLSGFDREGMVLIALMSGGDYLPEGIPGCGIKVACEAAKAGFGRICRLKASDTEGIQAWRESLIHEMRSNEQGFFRTKHKALKIPDTFPNIEVLRYYTHPAVSPEASLDAIRENMSMKRPIHLDGLREFARETFDWDYKIGAIKFIRVLSQALLVHKLQSEPSAAALIQRVSGHRTHFSTDASSELKITYIPQDIVPIDLSKEVEENIPFDRDGLALNSDEEFEAPTGTAVVADQPVPKVFDVTKPDSGWILEHVLRISAPKLLEEWHEAKKSKATRKSPKKSTKARVTKQTAMPHGALEKFVQITKTTAASTEAPQSIAKQPISLESPTRTPRKFRRPISPPRDLSKQHTSSAASNSQGESFHWNTNSQMSPRTPGDTEPIIISSSPPAPVPSSPSPRPRRSVCDAEDSANVVCAFTLENGGTSQRVRKHQTSSQKQTYSKRKPMKRTESATSFKQTSLDSFIVARSPGRLPSSAPSSSLDQDESTFDTSSILQTTAQVSKTRPAVKDLDEFFPAAKKLLIPRTSDIGYCKEVEVSADQVDKVIARETARLKSRGIKAPVSRWSDVSIVDLTGD